MYIKASNSLSPLTQINTVACKSNYSAKGSQSATLGLKGQKHFVRQNDFYPMDRLL